MKNKAAGKLDKILVVRGTVFVVLMLVIMFVTVGLILSRFNSRSYENVTQHVYSDITSGTEKKADELSIVLTGMLTTGQIAADFLSSEEDEGVIRDRLKAISENNRDLYNVAYVDINGRGICSYNEEEVNLFESDYFIASSQPYHSFTTDDRIDGRKALVSVIPVRKKEDISSYLIMYTDLEILKQYLPLEGDNRDNSVLIIDSQGNRLYSSGTPWIIVKSNLYITLAETTVLDSSVETISSNIESGVTQNFVAENGNNSCLFVTVPVKDTQWTLVDIVDKNRYLNWLIKEDSKYDQQMAKRVEYVVFAIALVLVCYVISSKVKELRNSKSLANKADTDLLTGLNNKISTEFKIQECLNGENDKQHLFFLFDVDNFKKINDTMGHAFGDLVLKTLGEQLSQEFRKTDILGRTGGDEFIIFLKDIKSDDIIEKEGGKLTSFFRQFQAGDYVKYSATASIGAAIYPRDGKSYEELYKSADSALYEAKKQGKNRLIYYNKTFVENMEKREKEAREKQGLTE